MNKNKTLGVFNIFNTIKNDNLDQQPTTTSIITGGTATVDIQIPIFTSTSKTKFIMYFKIENNLNQSNTLSLINYFNAFKHFRIFGLLVDA